MTAKTTEMTLNDGKDDKKDGKDDGERLAWCDDLTCGFILALLSAYWQHRPMFELVFCCMWAFLLSAYYKRTSANSKTKRSQHHFIHTSFILS